MTPAARVQAAIEIIDRWLGGDEGLDRVLAQWGRKNRYAGSGDRHAIADLVHDAVRRLASATWVAGADAPSGRSTLIGSLLLDGADFPGLEALFSGARYAPAPLEAAERAAIGRDLAEAPSHVQADIPDWLAVEVPPEFLLAFTALRSRAPLDLRVNLLRADPEEARTALAEDGVEAVPGPLAATCLRVTAGARRLRAARAYREGLVEIQDAASQAVAEFCAIAPGEAALDYCAGGGGKTLALAAAMAGDGRLVAHDTAPARLAEIAPRAARAGVAVELRTDLSAEAAGSFDLVLVDAPCSGSGAWRRNPDAKWRLSPARLDALAAMQAEILVAAARHVRPGGRLVYATCSMLMPENGNAVDAFLRHQDRFARDGAALELTPLDGGDGFFACRLRKRD